MKLRDIKINVAKWLDTKIQAIALFTVLKINHYFIPKHKRSLPVCGICGLGEWIHPTYPGRPKHTYIPFQPVLNFAPTDEPYPLDAHDKYFPDRSPFNVP